MSFLAGVGTKERRCRHVAATFPHSKLFFFFKNSYQSHQIQPYYCFFGPVTQLCCLKYQIFLNRQLSLARGSSPPALIKKTSLQSSKSQFQSTMTEQSIKSTHWRGWSLRLSRLSNSIKCGLT